MNRHISDPVRCRWIGVAAMILLMALSNTAVLAAQDLPTRDSHDTHALSRWISLPHDRQLLVLQSLGVSVPQDFYNCVCRAAGYGSPGTSQYYHPDTIGTYDERYSCQHPGPPCIVSGYGCSRHDLPSDPKIFESCAAKEGLAGGNPFDNILTALRERAERIALTGNPVTMNANPSAKPPPDCTKARAEAGLQPHPSPISDIPRERLIYALSSDAQLKLASLDMNADSRKALMQALTAAVQKAHEAGAGLANSADEIDLRFDLGPIEIGVTADEQKRIHISEITFKMQATKEHPILGAINGEGALKFGLGEPGDESGAHQVTGAKIGFSWEAGKFEAKYGIDIDTSRSATDYYDGEWRKASEYRLVRGLENMLANLDFYGGGAVNTMEVGLPGTDGGKLQVGVEASWKLKDRYSNWLFSDMNQALDDLLDNQKQWEVQRHDYIAREADRFGIDARCFSAGEAIRLTHDAYAQQKATDPGLAAPFQSITDRIAARRAKATEPPKPSVPPKAAAPPKPVPSETGIYQQQMLR